MLSLPTLTATDFVPLWPAQRNPPRQAVVHGPPNAEIGRIAADGVAGPLQIDGKGFFEALLDEVG